MLVAVDTSTFRDYTLERDRGDNPTIFEIGVLDGLLGPALMDQNTRASRSGGGEQIVEVKGGSYMANVVRFGLKGWKNFTDSKGNPVDFSRKQMNVPGVGMRWAVEDKCLALLESEWITELATAIQNVNTLTKEDEKKLRIALRELARPRAGKAAGWAASAFEEQRLIERTKEYSSLIKVLSMLETGMIVLTYSDLERIPATMLEAWMILKQVKKELQSER